MVVPPKHPKIIISSRKTPWLLGTTILGNPHLSNLVLSVLSEYVMSYQIKYLITKKPELYSTAASTATKSKVFDISPGARVEAWGLLDSDAQDGERHLHQHSPNEATSEFSRVR